MPEFKAINFSPWLSQYTVTEPRVVFHDTVFNNQTQVSKSIQSLPSSHAHVHHLRDGELAVYRRSDSRVWQYKFKQETGRWYRASTRKTILEQAIRVASDLYDESRYRERLGLAPQQKTFKDIAQTACLDMRRELTAGTGKKIYVDYCSVIERYFIPYFGDKYLQNIKHKDVADFEAWRNHRMGKTPKSSTLMTFASALLECIKQL